MEDPIKSYVLMSKKSAQIMEGYRVYFTDAKRFTDETPSPPGFKIFCMLDDDFDGWLMKNPMPEAGMNNLAIFFPRDWIAENFEVLSEL